MPTTANGDITIYATETYRKDSSRITQRPIFSRFDAAELDTLFIPGTLVDASFALDSYNHQLNVGIWLVSKRLIIHAKHLQAIRNRNATWTVQETHKEASMSSLVWPAKSDASGNGNTNKRICAFVNRSKLKILLCDANVNNCREVATLLRGCSYQVTSVGSTREVIYVLNCEGASIDIVLAEADLPMANSMKTLKYITQDQELRCIPVMRQHLHDRKVLDAWSDYLMMPLGSNVLFNLWTHVWRTRRMLGLPEKNIFHSDFERFVASTIYAGDASGKGVILQDEASSSLE
ncbi:Two-component response regulator-like APRR1 [Vitis vinifera]|uniref:Two-component response regulator-like APRR1 n=1 Tax=Vitis vinifera TaxID=29760 RepID=A0A438I174_VITVI|nr:Two-component response regulator-like APRR1 [Vitis vinifera]